MVVNEAGEGNIAAVRHKRAVEKLRILADRCQWTTRMPLDEPLLYEAYVFGAILDGADPVECLNVAFTLNLPPDEVPWLSRPQGTEWLVDSMRLDKEDVMYCWRSRHEPVWNHFIREPVRFWSLDGTDEATLAAVGERRFADLQRLTASPEDVRRRAATELDRALAHVRAVHRAYWDGNWRREHRGNGRYPEDHLWEATNGYLDILDAVDHLDGVAPRPPQ